MLLSPGFRSAAAMAGWDEEALLLATVVVEDTPVRESRQHKRRRLRTPLSTTSTRKRAPRRKPAVSIPPVVLRLDDDDDDEEQAADRGGETTNKETEAAVAVDGAKQIDKEGSLSEKAPIKGLPCMDRLREELSCAICLEICFEPSTTPCGHSFCIKCLKSAANKCGKRCPKCRQLISNARSCTINTVLWNTVQLLFPEEVETRKSSSSAVAATPPGGKTQSSSCEQNNSNTNISSRRSIRRSAAQASSSQVTERDTRSLRRRIGPSQSEDAAMALRLQREEFRVAFQGSREQQLRALRYARANLRAAASMTVHGRLRGRAT